MMILNEMLKYYRKKYQHTQWEVARAIGCSPSFIIKLESGSKLTYEKITEWGAKYLDYCNADSETILMWCGYITPDFTEWLADCGLNVDEIKQAIEAYKLELIQSINEDKSLSSEQNLINDEENNENDDNDDDDEIDVEVEDFNDLDETD